MPIKYLYVIDKLFSLFRVMKKNYLVDSWNVTMIIFCTVFMINNLEENMLV